MTLLIAGLVLFLGPHLVPTVPPLRAALLARLGERVYRGAFTACALLGLVLIVMGFARAPSAPQLFAPWPAAIAVAPVAVTIALVLFAAANTRTHIRRFVRHPMLLGLLIWAIVHLLANGDLRSTVLFGAFVAYALIDLGSAIGRHAVKTFVPQGKFDAIAIVAGIALALALMHFHGPLFGVALAGFGR
jgi:uncharacterized membrane protein